MKKSRNDKQSNAGAEVKGSAELAKATPDVIENAPACNKFGFLTDKIPFLKKIKNWHLALCFIVPVIIMYLIYVGLEIHPFGDGSVLVLDLNGQYVSFYEALRKAVYGDANLLYSFSRSLGGEFVGIYAYYIASPLSYIVALFPQSKILEALLCIFLIKTGISGFTFGFYLTKKDKNFNIPTVVLFSCMYALSAYAVVQQHNSMWIDALMWLPLVTYGIEEVIKKKRYKMFVIFFSLTLISNFYIGYMTCFYVIAYFFYYYFAHNCNGENNLLGEKWHFVRSSLRMLISGITAVGIAAFMLVGAYYALQFGKTTFTSTNWAFQIRYDFLDLIAKLFPGTYDTVRPEGLPFIYCGVLTLIMVPVYFFAREISPREKIAGGFLILFFIISFTVNPVDLIWHGFQKPIWLNYRYSFMFTFVLLRLAYKGFKHSKQVGSRVILGVGAFLGLIVIILQKCTFENNFILTPSKGSYIVGKLQTVNTIWFSLLAIGAYLAIVCVLLHTKHKQLASFVLLVVVCVEMFLNGLVCVIGLGDDVVYTKYSSYNNFIQGIRPVVEEVQSEDSSFYRMEKLVHRKQNDNMALAMKGVSNSTSTLNKSTIDYLRMIGFCSKSNWSRHVGSNPVNDSLLGIKYLVTQDNVKFSSNPEVYNQNFMLDRIYEKVATEGSYSAYENPYALSLAYVADPAIKDFSFFDENGTVDWYNPFDRLNHYFGSLLGENIKKFKVFVPIEESDVDITTSDCTMSYTAKHIRYQQSSSAKGYVYATTTIQKTGDLYFYVPTDNPRSATLTVNGEKYGTVGGDSTNRCIYLGYYEEGDEIQISLQVPDNSSIYIVRGESMFFTLDEEVFQDSIAALAEEQLIIDDKYSESHITGTLTTLSDNSTVHTTIPYDEGWIVKVDGERVETYELVDALIGFDIEDAGEHTVEFRYMPKCYVISFTCSVIFIALFALYMIFEKTVNAFLSKVGSKISTSVGKAYRKIADKTSSIGKKG